MRFLTTLILALATCALAAAQDGPQDYRFRQPPVNSMGLASLSDLRGKPVLIEFWGTR